MLRLSHTVLYSKGFYIESDNLFQDLCNTLNADGYKNINNYSDIAATLLAHCDIANMLETIQYSTISGIDVIVKHTYSECTTFIAIIKYCMHLMRHLDNKTWVSVTLNSDVLPINPRFMDVAIYRFIN